MTINRGSDNATNHCSDGCNSCTSNHNLLLKGIAEEQLQILEENRSLMEIGRGEYVFREGSQSNNLYCLRKGKVMITISDDAGNSIITNLHKEVTFLGLSDYILARPYQSRCVALTDVQVCLLTRKNFDHLMSSNKLFIERVLVALAEQGHEAKRRMLAATSKQMHARLSDALLYLEEVFGLDNEGYLDVYLKRGELAMLANMNEANIIRNLSSFNKSSAVALEGKKLKILKRDLLTKWSSTG